MKKTTTSAATTCTAIIAHPYAQYTTAHIDPDTLTLCADLAPVIDHMHEERTRRHADRITRAQLRHEYDLDTLPAVIIATDPDHAAHLYAIAHAAAAVCLRARSQAEGGEGYISTVRRQWANDNRWERAADFAAVEAIRRAEHDQHREAAEAAQAIADKLTREAYKLTTSPAEAVKLEEAAAIHAHTAQRERDAAEDARREADAIAAMLEDTAAADRESIVHEAVAGYLAAIADAGEAITEGEAFRAACSAAGKAIDATRAAAGYTATKTRLQRMGGEGSSEADNLKAFEAWQQQHPHAERVPFAVRGGMSSGYWTAEQREASKPRKDGTSRRPAGYYLVAHYRTTTTAPLSEAMSLEAPQPVSLLDVRALLTDASLTKRQRAALLLLTVATGAAKPTSTDPAKVERIRKAAAHVARAGLKAVQQHDTETAAAVEACDTQRKRQRKQRERDKQRESVRAAAELDAALTLAGVPATQLPNQRKALRDKLTAAMERTRHDQTPRKAAPAAAQPVTITRQDAAGRDLYTVTPDTSKPAARHPYPGHVATVGGVDVVWSARYNPAEAVTITEADRRREEEQRRAEDMQHTAERWALDLRRTCRDHAPTRTAYAAHDAQSAAAVFLNALTPAELAEVGRALLAEAEARAAKQAAMRAAAKASGMFSLNLTFEQWKALTPEQRAAHQAWLNSL